MFYLLCIFFKANFCNVADFTLYLLICKFVTLVKRLKKISNIFKYLNTLYTLNALYSETSS